MTTSATPLMAALTARLVYVQSCALCRETAAAYAATCVADPAIASCQLIASKKNHCCENGEAVDRSTRASTGEWTREKYATLLEQMIAPLPSETPPPAAAISDTNGSDPDAVDRALWATLHDTPNGFDPP